MAGGSAGSIFVDLQLNDGKYRVALRNASNELKRNTGQWSGDLRRVQGAFSATINPINNMAGAFKSLAIAAAGALSTQKIIEYSDQWRQLEGRLSLIVGSVDELAAAQNSLADIASRTRQPLEGIVDFYTRLNQFIPEAERNSYDLLGVTESIATALAITGETGASASAALIQFTQAIGTNFEAAGQELRSLQEQAPRLTTALMRALGDGTKSLQQLKEEGALTRASVLSALSSFSSEGVRLREEYSNLTATISQAFTVLNNSVLEFVGKSQTIKDATSGMAEAIIGLSGFIRDLANDSSVADTAIYGLTAKLVDFYRIYNEQAVKVAEATNFFGLRDEAIKEYETNVEKAIKARQRLEDELYNSKAPVPRSESPIGGGGVFIPPAATDKDAAKRAKQLQGIIEGLRQENEQIAIKVDMHGKEKSAIDAALRSQATYTKIQEAGVKLTATQKAEVDSLLESLQYQESQYNRLEDEAKKAAEAERARMEGLEQLGSTVASAFEDAIVEGKGLGDVLNGLIQDIARLIIRLQITEPLVHSFKEAFRGGSGGGGGFFGDLFGSLFGGGGEGVSPGYSNAGDLWNGYSLPSYDVGAWRVGSDQVAKIHKDEMIIPAAPAEQFRNGMMGGGVNITVINNGNEKVRTEQSNNGKDIRVIIGEFVSNEILTPGSSIGRALDTRGSRGLVAR